MSGPLQEVPTESLNEHPDRHDRAYRQAQALFKQEPDWVTFFREVLGPQGIVKQLYSTPEELAGFEKTSQYSEIQLMLANLRKGSKPPATEPTRVITVRLPKTIHEALRAEAHDHHASMNQLCISKLLQMVDGELVPTEG